MKKIITSFLFIMVLITNLFIPAVNAKAMEVLDDVYYVKKTTNGKKDILEYLSQGQIDVGKKSIYQKDGVFNIEIVTDGKGFNENNNETANIVFVLDASGSMWFNNPGNQHTNTKALDSVNAVNDAISKVYDNEKIKISVVAFSTNSETILSFNEFDQIRSQYQTYGELMEYLQSKDQQAGTNGKYSSGLIGYKFKLNGITYYGGNNNTRNIIVNYPSTISANEATNENMNIYSTITGKEPEQSSTNIQSGVIRGYDELLNASNKQVAKPIMIFMTDGLPTYYSSSQQTSPSELSALRIIKNSEVYNIPMYQGGLKVDSKEMNQLALLAVLQIKYISIKMNEINSKKAEIHTIGYDLSTFESGERSLANAILNPTTANLNAAHNAITETSDLKSLKTLLTDGSGETLWNKSNLGSPYPTSYTYSTKVYEAVQGTGTSGIESTIDKIIEDTLKIEMIKPLKAQTYLTITDNIGEGFVYENNLKINDKNYELTNGTVTSSEGIIVTLNSQIFEIKIPAAISDENNKVSFDVKLVDRKIEHVYKTNDGLEYTFNPADNNPFYDEPQTEAINITGTIELTDAEEIEVPNTGIYVWIGGVIGGLALIAGGYFLIIKKRKTV